MKIIIDEFNKSKWLSLDGLYHISLSFLGKNIDGNFKFDHLISNYFSKYSQTFKNEYLNTSSSSDLKKYRGLVLG